MHCTEVIAARDRQMVEDEVYQFTAFASDLGFRAGHWPKEFDTYRGNAHPFVLFAGDQYGNRVYRQIHGCLTIKVFND